MKIPLHTNPLIILETAVGSQKSAQALGAPSTIKKYLITTEVTTNFLISLCTPISYTAFLRQTAVSRIIRTIYSRHPSGSRSPSFEMGPNIRLGKEDRAPLFQPLISPAHNQNKIKRRNRYYLMNRFLDGRNKRKEKGFAIPTGGTLWENGEPRAARTHDPRLKRAMLYQLS